MQRLQQLVTAGAHTGWAASRLSAAVAAPTCPADVPEPAWVLYFILISIAAGRQLAPALGQLLAVQGLSARRCAGGAMGTAVGWPGGAASAPVLQGLLSATHSLLQQTYQVVKGALGAVGATALGGAAACSVGGGALAGGRPALLRLVFRLHAGRPCTARSNSGPGQRPGAHSKLCRRLAEAVCARSAGEADCESQGCRNDRDRQEQLAPLPAALTKRSITSCTRIAILRPSRAPSTVPECSAAVARPAKLPTSLHQTLAHSERS